MKRTIGAAGAAACLGLSLIVVGATLGQGSPEFASLRTPILADSDPAATEPGRATPVGAGTPKPPAGAVPTGQAITELRSARGKDAPSLVLNSAGTIKSVTAAPGRTLAAQRDAFTTRYAAGFGASSTSKLQTEKSSKLPGGDSVTRYQQVVGGLPVLGGELLVTTDGKGAVRGALSALDSTTPKAVNATTTADAARATAIKAFGDEYAISADQIAEATVKLWLADPAKYGQPGSGLGPIYWVKLTSADGGELGDVIVDALTGKVGLVASDEQTARSRRVCDLANARRDLNYRSQYACTPSSPLGTRSTTRSEGRPASSVADVNAAYNHLGIVYDYYRSTFGLDSFDGRGAEIRATVRVCDLVPEDCPLANASWEGTQFIFGQGYIADDVVYHEFTHAVTQYSADLLYWYESGALNEAFSDIMAQFLDLRTPNDDVGVNRWRVGESVPGGAIRDMANPNPFLSPASYNDPRWFQGTGDSGGVHYNSGVANKLASLLADGGVFNGITVRGIGIDRSEQIWYRALHLLSSGADYRELRLALGSACLQLIGTHYIRAEHCGDVEKAMTAVQLPLVGANEKSHAAESCPGSPYEAPATIFFDDFEDGSAAWTSSNDERWQPAPGPVVPYTYASSGKGSLNGWTEKSPATGLWSDPPSSAELVTAIALPAGKDAYLQYSTSVLLQSGSTSAGVQVLGASGDWTEVKTITAATPGYTSHRVDLSAYKGQNVKVRFMIKTSSFIDWYIDDVRLYNCTGRPGAPTNPIAYSDGTSIRVCWGLPQFTGAGPSSWDVQVTPNGAPVELDRSQYNGREQLQVKKVTPGTTYSIAVRYVSNGQAGEPVTFKVNATTGSYALLFTVGFGRPAPGPRPVCGGDSTVVRR